jgi:hypothetical protein
VRSAHSSAHGGGDDNENHDDPNDHPLLPRVPRHPSVDGPVLVRRRRFFFTVAHGARAGVSGSSALFCCCAAASLAIGRATAQIYQFQGGGKIRMSVHTYLILCPCGIRRRGRNLRALMGGIGHEEKSPWSLEGVGGFCIGFGRET